MAMESMSEASDEIELERVARRITELVKAFRALAKNTPGLSVEVVGQLAENRRLVHPVAGFHVRLQPTGRDRGVAVYVSARYGELTRWTPRGALRERFNVNIDEEFGWGETVFPDGTALAQALLGYMQFNFDSLGD
jgi:hypothetical protein